MERIKGLLRSCSFIFIGWLMDLISSNIGFSMAQSTQGESSQLFLMAPYGWLMMAVSLAATIYFFKWAPARVRKILLKGVTVGSFLPSIRNLSIIVLVIL